ncbi:hypothetical protein OG394_27870 [Kribbella sp. NBC_01245]|uniref:hypothetical protein n=1 Tax=Kribbella sp. NBC_01245 TaxID=2903578 RepID=UPI002E2C2ED9|nr:hypothetical protein [Kribbella sp. NBC_01245]
MELDHYLESVRRSVENATALADDQTRSVAQRLGATLDDAGRLALISALSDAAGEISRELSPGSVELRMAGGRPEFVVTPAPSQLTGPDDDDSDNDDTAEDTSADQIFELDADEPTARITLRLPMSVKTKVDEAANAEGISANAWLMRTVMTGLTGDRDRGRRGPRPPRPPRPPRGFDGVFGPDGPLGPDGPFGKDGAFGPNGPFGPEGVFGERGGRRGERGERGEHGHGRGGRRGGQGGPGQRMQGWAQ